ncbi:hypothetical protein VTH06DRAFT_6567 [Thermothelomyces fergusii]
MDEPSGPSSGRESMAAASRDREQQQEEQRRQQQQQQQRDRSADDESVLRTQGSINPRPGTKLLCHGPPHIRIRVDAGAAVCQGNRKRVSRASLDAGTKHWPAAGQAIDGVV